MESCIHCGHCADACHFYKVTGDPKYTPIWKLEPFKQAYKREAGPFAFAYRAFNLKPKVTIEELEEWQHLLYDTCTVCGRCTMICPMGIDIATLISQARHGMFAGRAWCRTNCGPSHSAPNAKAARWAPRESAEGTRRVARRRLRRRNSARQAARRRHLHAVVDRDHEIPGIDRCHGENHEPVGSDWTLRSDGYEATNFGLLSGNAAWQKDLTMKLINAAVAAARRTLMLPECGHAYGALRWQGAKPTASRCHSRCCTSPSSSREGANGRIKLKKLNKSVTFHDPCQVSRRGGATQAPRDVLQALGVDLREMRDAAISASAAAVVAASSPSIAPTNCAMPHSTSRSARSTPPAPNCR